MVVSLPYVLEGPETKKFTGKRNKVISHFVLSCSLQSQYGHQPKPDQL